MMSKFIVKVLNPVSEGEKRHKPMYIIIRQPYKHLFKEMCRTFGANGTVKVMVDRRHGQRRKKSRPVKSERRQANRRRSKEDLLEVVLVA